ncbi:prolipoprotein diacylglyceryl transferase [Treponema sp.]|uniref:prolipoprotein diacylglyceryl transferase n=1 Tax=Treponema sp. TaxID=166 RepID=UPI003FD6C393
MNFLPLYINYPSWIHPEIFPGVPVLGLIRWYGLMYIFAFGTAFLVLKKLLKEGALDEISSDGTLRKATEDDIFSFIATGIIFLLVGARIFSTLVYDTSRIYWKKPWLIFWPFNSSGQFTGLAGMSYHGGFIGGLIGMIFWCKKNKRQTLKWIDAMVTAIPLGYTFGRLGNFLNGELYGRITSAPWGIIFPQAERFSASFQWVKDFASKCNLQISSLLVNLPRHPSQLYEAFFEGLVLFSILWFLRKKKPFDGFSGAIYTIGYGIFRFFIEYFREPDSDIGYRIASDTNAPLYLNTSLFNISTGQILCLLMVLGGISLAIFSYLLSKKENQQKSA